MENDTPLSNALGDRQTTPKPPKSYSPASAMETLEPDLATNPDANSAPTFTQTELCCLHCNCKEQFSRVVLGTPEALGGPLEHLMACCEQFAQRFDDKFAQPHRALDTTTVATPAEGASAVLSHTLCSQFQIMWPDHAHPGW